MSYFPITFLTDCMSCLLFESIVENGDDIANLRENSSANNTQIYMTATCTGPSSSVPQRAHLRRTEFISFKRRRNARDR